jgi:hypothetical protein
VKNSFPFFLSTDRCKTNGASLGAESIKLRLLVIVGSVEQSVVELCGPAYLLKCHFYNWLCSSLSVTAVIILWIFPYSMNFGRVARGLILRPNALAAWSRGIVPVRGVMGREIESRGKKLRSSAKVRGHTRIVIIRIFL